jgi:ABC-type branched-subunit amino acid transport system substrate-binding protein
VIVPRTRRRVAAVALASLLVVVAACGDDDDDRGAAAEADGRATGTQACPGEPIRITMIASMTGPVAASATDLENGRTAAVEAVNASCELGRPLDVEICDDQSNPNESLACGRAAAADSIALLDSLSTLQDGPAASGLPVVLSLGATTFDLTNANSYPAGASPVVVMGEVSAATALGASDAVFVAPDLPYTQTAFATAKGLAASLDLELESLFYPAETTDFAPVAAQIADADPNAIIVLSGTPLPIFNALDAVGISPAETPVITIAAFVPPETIAALGDRIEGTYLVTQILPPSEEDNTAIEQMRQDYEAAELDFDDDGMSSYAVLVWSNIHILVDAMSALDDATIASLDGPALVDALVAASPIEHPARAPFDYTKRAFTDGPLASFRIFSRDAMVLRIEDGLPRPLTGFTDVTAGFDLE